MLKLLIDQQHPVIVLLQAWAERRMTLEEWHHNYEDGHYAIVVGYSNALLLFEDPASFRRTWLSEREFKIRWHDIDIETNEKIERFGMVLLGRQPILQAPKHMD